ncbi:MAG: triose-phosphate isomerase [Novosphingobium sp.]
MANRPYIVGNWKMNGTRASLSEARAIDRGAARNPGVQVGIAPPATLLALMAEAVETVSLGGQDCHQAASGAFTGDISAAMLADVGASFVIVGHSERRTLHGESNELVKSKADAALNAGLGVIVCVGETEAERDAGKAEKVVGAQLDGSLPDEAGTPGQVTVAYEPVWAIGTGRVPSTDDVSAMHRAIRAQLEKRFGAAHAGVRILYGGSVNAGNAAELLACDEVGGALVGGASLTADSFLTIVSAAAPLAD